MGYTFHGHVFLMLLSAVFLRYLVGGITISLAEKPVWHSG